MLSFGIGGHPIWSALYYFQSSGDSAIHPTHYEGMNMKMNVPKSNSDYYT